MFSGHFERDLFALLWASEETCHCIGRKVLIEIGHDASTRTDLFIFSRSARSHKSTEKTPRLFHQAISGRIFQNRMAILNFKSGGCLRAKSSTRLLSENALGKVAGIFFFENFCWELDENASLCWQSFGDFAILWKISEPICGVGFSAKLRPSESN